MLRVQGLSSQHQRKQLSMFLLQDFLCFWQTELHHLISTLVVRLEACPDDVVYRGRCLMLLEKVKDVRF